MVDVRRHIDASREGRATGVALDDVEAIRLMSYLLSSASTLVTEPSDYGPMRLLTAALHLAEFWRPSAPDDVLPLLDRLIDQVPGKTRTYQSSSDAYLEFVESCVQEVADLLPGTRA